MSRRPPRSTLSSSSAASDVYKREVPVQVEGGRVIGPAGVVGIEPPGDVPEQAGRIRPGQVAVVGGLVQAHPSGPLQVPGLGDLVVPGQRLAGPCLRRVPWQGSDQGRLERVLRRDSELKYRAELVPV